MADIRAFENLTAAQVADTDEAILSRADDTAANATIEVLKQVFAGRLDIDSLPPGLREEIDAARFVMSKDGDLQRIDGSAILDRAQADARTVATEIANEISAGDDGADGYSPVIAAVRATATAESATGDRLVFKIVGWTQSTGTRGESVSLFRGAYDAGVTYQQGDIVLDGGAFYISLVADNTGNATASATHWLDITATGGGGGNGGGGLTTQQATALIATWARATGASGTVPDAVLPDTAKRTDAQVDARADARVRAGTIAAARSQAAFEDEVDDRVAEFAQEGTSTIVPDAKLPAAAKRTDAAIRALATPLIALWARATGRSGRAPKAALPADTVYSADARLAPTPTSTDAGDFVAVNSAGNALEYVDAPTGGGGGLSQAQVDARVVAGTLASARGQSAFVSAVQALLATWARATGASGTVPDAVLPAAAKRTDSAIRTLAQNVMATWARATNPSGTVPAARLPSTATRSDSAIATLAQATVALWARATGRSGRAPKAALPSDTLYGVAAQLPPAPTSGDGGDFVAVNSAGNALEFVDAPSGGGGGTTATVATDRAGKTSAGKLLLASSAEGSQVVNAWSGGDLEVWEDSPAISSTSAWRSSKPLPTTGFLVFDSEASATSNVSAANCAVISCRNLQTFPTSIGGALTEGVDLRSRRPNALIRYVDRTGRDRTVIAGRDATGPRAGAPHLLLQGPDSSSGLFGGIYYVPERSQLLDGVAVTFPSGGDAGEFVATTADVPTLGSLIVQIADRVSPTLPAGVLADVTAAAAGDTPSATTAVQWGGAGSAGSGGGGGLTQAQVDARVAAGVLDWAEQGNTDVVPDPKLPAAAKRTDSAIQSLARALIATWARATGASGTVPAAQLPSTATRSDSVIQGLARALIATWARATGATGRAPKTALPADTLYGVAAQLPPAPTSGDGGDFVAVNSAGDALEFVDAPSGGGGVTGTAHKLAIGISDLTRSTFNPLFASDKYTGTKTVNLWTMSGTAGSAGISVSTVSQYSVAFPSGAARGQFASLRSLFLSTSMDIVAFTIDGDFFMFSPNRISGPLTAAATRGTMPTASNAIFLPIAGEGQSGGLSQAQVDARIRALVPAGVDREVQLSTQTDVTPGTGQWGSWTDLHEITVAAAEVGRIAVFASAHGIAQTTTPPQGGGNRIWSDVRVVRTRGGADVVLEDVIFYGPRSGGNFGDSYAVSREYGGLIAYGTTVQSGDVLTMQVRHWWQEAAGITVPDVRYANDIGNKIKLWRTGV